MKVLSKKELAKIIEILKSEELLCSPTDTLFGILGNALSKKVANRIYAVKKRNPHKPLIVLFDSVERLKEFGIIVPKMYLKALKKLYPSSMTAVLSLSECSPFKKILKRENLAVRIPADEFLQHLIEETFPLFAPSANPEGEEPARNCKECKNYFEGQIKYCIEGKSNGIPSTIVDLTKSKPLLLRDGMVKFEKILEVLNSEKS